MSPNILIVGATRGLGASLAQEYTQKGATVFGTARASTAPSTPSNVTWLTDIDVSKPDVGSTLVSSYKSHTTAPVDILIISAGYFGKESFASPSHSAQLTMYATTAIAPTLVVPSLAHAGLLAPRGGGGGGGGGKVVLVSSESGSVGLRHASEGGGNYGHHGSKAALNMVGRLLSLDLAAQGVAVAVVHPGFMRTDMTKGVGFDEFWDVGGAVTPDVAAKSLVEWVDTFDMSKTGEYWAPRGPGDIGTAEPVLGPKDKLPTPLQLPW